MHSESKSTRSILGSGAAALSLFLALAFHAGPAHAEDPLLGQIKVIKCVGCDPGAVNLVVHDPIDVRDFEVQIKEADYQKIITPLAGKTVYDKNGCFYWMDAPKGAKPPAGKAKDAEKKAAKKPAKKEAAAAPDSNQAGGVVETSAPAASPEPDGVPSKCIPYVRIEPKPTNPKGKKSED